MSGVSDDATCVNDGNQNKDDLTRVTDVVGPFFASDKKMWQ